MAKVKIDGQEFEMEDAVAKAVQKVCDDLTETRSLLKRADAAIKESEGEEDEVKTDKTDSYTPAEIATIKSKVVRKFVDGWNKLVGERDAANGKVAGLEAQRVDSMTPEKVAEAVQQKFRVVAVAAARMDGEKVVELAKLSDAELKKKVVLHANPAAKLDGKSAEFIDGMFETIAGQVGQADMGRIMGEMLIPTEASQVRPGQGSLPKTDGWKKPLAVSKA